MRTYATKTQIYYESRSKAFEKVLERADEIMATAATRTNKIPAGVSPKYYERRVNKKFRLRQLFRQLTLTFKQLKTRKPNCAPRI